MPQKWLELAQDQAYDALEHKDDVAAAVGRRELAVGGRVGGCTKRWERAVGLQNHDVAVAVSACQTLSSRPNKWNWGLRSNSANLTTEKTGPLLVG
jgi:hypothetical protein